MGVVHKLKPEVIKFILDNKQANPHLSCRSLIVLLLEEFQVEVSKSSINSIFKENNLSMPVGRRQKLKKKKFNMPVLPVIEGVKAIMLVAQPSKPVEEQTASPSLPGSGCLNTKSEIASGTTKEEPGMEENRIKEAEEWAIKLQEDERIRVEEKLSLEKQRLKDEQIKIKTEEAAKKAEQDRLAKEAQEQAHQAEEEKKRLEEEAKLKAEERAIKLQEDERIRVEEKLSLEKQRLKDEQIKIKTEEAAKNAEQDKLAKEAQEQVHQAEEEKKRLEEEAELKAEREKWARLAEEELKSKQLTAKEEVSIQKNEINLTGLLPPNRVCSGAIFLKAIDCLIGVSKQINEVICKRTGNHPEDFITLTQAVIFRSLFDKDNLALLSSLVGQQIPQEKLDNYYTEINQNKAIRLEIVKIISNAFTEARAVKVHFIDGSIVYLDGQLHTTWSTPYLPYNFASAVYDLKNNLNKYFFQDQPLVLLSAPGDDLLSKEFFNLLLNISSPDKGPDSLILYGNKLEEFESISLNHRNNYSFVFGLWPWQFTTARKIKKIGNFNSEHIAGIDKDLYLAEIEIDLLQPSTSQSISLQGCAVKTDLRNKIQLVILSSDQSLVNLNKLAQIYLSHWPNLDEGLLDFNHKVEVFTYTGSTQKFFSTEIFGLSMTETNFELEETFANYIKILDAYLRWHFLPAGYIEKSFSFTNECFYKASVKLATGQAKVIAQMQINQAQLSLKDSEYLLRRFNERQIDLGNGKFLYFENAFK